MQRVMEIEAQLFSSHFLCLLLFSQYFYSSSIGWFLDLHAEG
jgi:hypothetical protein